MNGSAEYNFTRLDEFFWYESSDCDDLMKIWYCLEYRKTYDGKIANEFGTYEGVYDRIVRGLSNYSDDLPLETPPRNEEFWTWAMQSDIQGWVQADGEHYCASQMCKAVGWEGNPDLAGVGMLTTYIIQTVLVTIYLVAILTIRLDKLPIRLRGSHLVSRTLLAMQHSTTEFLSASAKFSLALLVASIYSIAQPELTKTFSSWILSLVIPLNSVLPVVILNVSASGMLRRSKGRVLLWLVTAILIIVLAARSSPLFNGEDSNGHYGYKDVEPKWDSPCLKTRSFRRMAFFSWTIAGVLCLGIIGYITDFVASWSRSRPEGIIRLSNPVQYGIIGISVCTTWFIVGWLLKLTLDVRARAGKNNRDNEWTIGQVLALATWVPFMVEFAYIWWELPEAALNGRLMAPYKVVSTSTRESPFEMLSPDGDKERGHFQRLE